MPGMSQYSNRISTNRSWRDGKWCRPRFTESVQCVGHQLISSRGLEITKRMDRPQPEGQKKDCPMDPYMIIHGKSTFFDSQTLKLQEAPDMVPVGELPRHMLLSVDRLVQVVTSMTSINKSNYQISDITRGSWVSCYCDRNLLYVPSFEKRMQSFPR
jgi:MCM OB domain